MLRIKKIFSMYYNPSPAAVQIVDTSVSITEARGSKNKAKQTNQKSLSYLYLRYMGPNAESYDS